MSEAMALERMTQILAELEGYLTATRIPYLSLYDSSGSERAGLQHGDLDLVGLGPNGQLLVAECKGYGSPEDYPSWLTVDKLWFLQDLVWSASNNIQRVNHVRWGPEFEARNSKPDEVWIVFSGSFFPHSDPKRLKVNDPEYKPFIKEMSKVAQPIWDSREEDEKQTICEIDLLARAEEFLGKKYDVQVRLYPIHRLIHELFIKITKDMVTRRKRYPDTAMEMLRWITRAVWSGDLDLTQIQEEILNL
ncbi:MAG: hypothetical protein HYR94_11515 [Chloroflexi bacterium]|nr:hypothetical protein [Chloroflexota bacterium]